jgi:Ala-tRNA(Pro) deacylase
MMESLKKVKEFLESKRISYQLLEHTPAFTALETAEAQHVPGRQLIKTVIVDADGTLVMCVLPSTHKIDFDQLGKILRSSKVQLAEEKKLKILFPEYELGAMPPFGQLAGLKVYADKVLEENETVAFNAGTHTDLIRIKFKDYVRLTNPVLADFGLHI